MRQTDWIHRSAQKAVSIGRDWTVGMIEPADASDWCSHGAGSTAQIGVQGGDRLGWVAYISWAGDWAGLLGWERRCQYEACCSECRGRDDSGLRGCIVGARVNGSELPYPQPPRLQLNFLWRILLERTRAPTCRVRETPSPRLCERRIHL
jgi:hypothetical protein